ncbi:MAG: flagellar biosynthesis protein FlhF [Treponema sp.]|jgi:flagellar biosynthesis protein FlhF|nr:flagellar biosynthesis protein FlhF [Treponema sp.]
MEMYKQQGTSRKDCELKIVEKYKVPFHVLSEKEIRIGGFMGLFSRPGVEIEFYFTHAHYRNPLTHGYNTNAPISWHVHEPENRRQHTAANLEEEKRKVLAAAGKNYDEIAASGREASQQILDSLKEIKEKIESGGRKKEEHPAFVRAAELLKVNDFSENYINGMLERLRKELSLETLGDMEAVQNHLLEWVGESISIYKEDGKPRSQRIMILVGPTGVGKTTTITKLAAIYGIGTSEIPSVNVRMITIDAFRIGAKEQLEKYGDIMQIPVSYVEGKTAVEGKMALRKEIALFSQETDLFLIDTIGKSPKDAAKLGEIKEILEGCGRGAEIHLVICAGTKTSDIEDILRQFEPFNYRSVILTKMDETYHIGNVISALSEKKKSVSYITDGQKVPNDIKKASVVRFLINLDGFRVDREKIENRFPSGEADQFKWS